MNNNILINSNFANPVNQRGWSSGKSGQDGKFVYTIDRWGIFGSIASGETELTVEDGHIVLSGTSGSSTNTASIYQKIEYLPVGVYSLSAKIDGVIYKATLNYNNAYIHKDFGNGIFMGLSSSTNSFFITIDLTTYESVNIEWAKLEEGEVATPYVPRLYAEELLLCQRYYQKIYYRDSILYGIFDNDLIFVKEIEPMRVNPTVDISELVLSCNAVNQTGFKISVDSSSSKYINVICNKTSHGLTVNSCPTLGTYIYLDAEL